MITLQCVVVHSYLDPEIIVLDSVRGAPAR